MKREVPSPVTTEPLLSVALPKRQRVTDYTMASIRNPTTSTTGARVSRKRTREPRPHPPHCLNKRFWDDMRAGRIPDRPAATTNFGAQENRSPPVSSSDAFTVSDSTSAPVSSSCQPTNMIPGGVPKLAPPRMHLPPPQLLPPFLTPFPPLGMFPPLPPPASGFPMPFLFGPHPHLAAGGNPMMAVSPGVLGHSSPSPRPPSELRKERCSPRVPQHDVHPCTSAETASDEDVDRIVNSMVASAPVKRIAKDASKKEPRVCIIPIPMPIIVPIPVTADFIRRKFTASAAECISKSLSA